MPTFIRVTDPSTGHQFDVTPEDGRLLDGSLHKSKAADAVIEGPFVRAREPKFRTDLAGNPAGKASTTTTAQEA